MSADRGGSGEDGAGPFAGGWPSDPERKRRDRDTVVAAFATVLYLALVVCAFGFVSLLADVDVVSRGGTGGLVGPAMVATAVIVVLAALVRDARRAGGAAGRGAAWSLLVGLGATVGFVGVGVVLVAVEARRWFDGVLFASSTLMSAFPWIVGVLAAVVAIAFAAVTAGSTGRRPRWPWEAHDDSPSE
ncbi:hypothetical protein CLV49_0363 [Labedella gwakjiensis]|uniref:Uncharacterized protein n=1 Tax=Labedella gwakjiensis TaxID=390269 RepID=A0A2P8GS38_9MICO|nr:DUF6121 family protein [Labedella gwakjiensis]PSL36765.1 hypothetical protein CLV49_0363 [Labedella gwakjiensis]RUQ84278.1 hypothetical protein ELQ93_15795 [Labedella gwakjiensis]